MSTLKRLDNEKKLVIIERDREQKERARKMYEERVIRKIAAEFERILKQIPDVELKVSLLISVQDSIRYGQQVFFTPLTTPSRN